MKKTYCNLAAAFAIAFAATSAFSADDGDIYEFKPVTEVATAATALGAAQTVEFKMRLLSPNYSEVDESKRVQWQVFYKPDPFLTQPGAVANYAAAWAANPPKVGIVVSGQTRGATLSLPAPLSQRRFTEFECTYVTKYGDLALPIKLATDGKGTAVGDGQKGGFDPSTDGQYYFLNDSTWGIGYLPDGALETYENIVWLKPYRRQTVSVMPPEGVRNGSFDLAYGFDPADAGGAYFVKTLGFDAQSATDSSGTYWRIVNEKRTTCKPDVPALRVDNMPEDPQNLYVYVWSENDDVVTVKFSESAAELAAAGVTKETFKDRTGVSRDFWVKKIKLDGLTVEYPFAIRGVAGASGSTTALVMSAKVGYRFDGAGDLLEDFLVADVKCGDPLLPTVTVKVNGGSAATVDAVPQNNVATRVATLTVEVSDPYTGDLVVDISPKLAVDGVPGGDAFDYFGISEKAESLSYLDKVSKVTFTAADFSVAATSYSKTLYVYSWGADANTFAVNKSVGFYPSVADAAAAAFYSGGMEEAYLQVKPIKPEIVEPVADQLISVNASVAYPLTVKVSDTYNDMKSDTGYELFIKRDIGDLNFTSLGFFKPDAEGVLYSVPTLADPEPHQPLVTWENTATEKAVLYVKSPESQEKSEERQISLFVKPARQIAVEATDGKDGNQYLEGEDVNVSIKLENGSNDTGDTIYAFLVPQGEAVNAVNATWIAKDGCYGREIPKSGSTVSGIFTLVDGTYETAQGATYDFKIELRTKKSYSDPDGKVVAGFESKTLTVYSKNVIPAAEFVELNDGIDTVDADGGQFETIIAKDVPTKFQMYVNEPGTYDKTTTEVGKMFKTRWIVKEQGKTPVSTIVEGNPDTIPFMYTFTKAGVATIEVDFMDKDMADKSNRWGNGVENKKFTFKIEVVSNPLITITTYTTLGQFYEDECTDFGGEAAIDVNVSMNPLDEPLRVQLTVVPPSYAEADNPGKFKLQTDANCSYTGVDGDGNDVYEVTLDGILAQTVYVKTLDGTPLSSKNPGFTIKSKVLNDTIYPNGSGKKSSEYYIGVDRSLLVKNSDPTAEITDFYPMPGSTNHVAIGTADPITWNFTDVDADFAKGITVTIKQSGGGHTETVYDAASASGSWAPTFKSSGLQIVTMTITDKDNGRVRDPELIWYYEVEVSKKLNITPNGPADGGGGANSVRYSKAKGLGRGHVYAGSPASVSEFTSTYNCGIEKTWTLWGFGYKVDTPVDDGTLDGGKDFGLTPAGEKTTAEPFYTYRPESDKSGKPVDSFLYAWLQYVVGEGEASSMTDSLLGATINPETVTDGVSMGSRKVIALPTELLDDGTYADVMIEAIFSREYRSSDNMGDMNQDGIPDSYLLDYGFDVYDTVGRTVTGDDLKNIADYNDDEDVLPATASATIASPSASNAWSVVTMPFSAIYEIRGYHDGLNIPGVTEMDMSDNERRAFKRYLVSIADCGDPDVTAAIEAFTSATDTSSDAYTNETAKLEAVFNKKTINGRPVWTPENPTDPTKDDTDGDGISDGYEYYFWYCAHVMGATGERYGFWSGDVSKPTVISSEEIERLFDPNVKRDWNTGGQFATDTDGDGLPDMVEILGTFTNPIHWDTDGDGMPDGLEVMRGTDPLVNDASANPDGDYMAYAVVPDQLVVELDNAGKIEIWSLDNVYSKSKNGETYYKYAMAPWPTAAQYEHIAYVLVLKNDSGDDVPQYAFLTEKDDEDEAKAEFAKYADNDQTLVDMPVRKLYATSVEVAPGEKKNRYWFGAATTLKAGTQFTSVQADGTIKVINYWAKNSELGELEPKYSALVDGTHEDDVPNGLDPAAVPGLFSVYRLGDAENGAYSVKMSCKLDSDYKAKSQVRGTLTYYGGNPTGTVDLTGLNIVRIETAGKVARYHAQVFAENGFDPRTGWGSCQDGYCAERWCETCSRNKKSAKEALTAGLAVNTAGFTAINEYRLMHYRYMNGIESLAKDLSEAVSKKKTLTDIWSSRTTNPQVTKNDAGDVTSHGADTDGDGVPDGWELYVLKNPNPSPNGTDATDDEWDLLHVDGGWSAKRDGDGLELHAEFAGTDTLLAYIDCPTIGGKYKGAEEGKLSGWIWLNKFFPTNPYSSDTDGDGLSDAEEQAVGMDRNDYSGTQYGNSDPRVKPTSFIYGANKDLNVDGNKWGYPDDDGSICIRGGGLNPCSIDTDGDRLPDGWEYQFAGIYRASAAAAKEEGGYLDFGMDGTDPYDAYTYKRGSLYPEDVDPRTGTLRNFDFDLDGLQNFQEYLTQALRHFRYDVTRIGTTTERGTSAPLIEGVMNGTPLYQITLSGPLDYVFGPSATAKAKPADDATRRGFFGAPPREWDLAALREGGTRYARFMLMPGTTWGISKLPDVWKPNGYVPAHSYATTDPRMRDSDLDGMDDFYELFHGLNPLLGQRAAIGGAGADLVALAYSGLAFGPEEILPLDCFNNWFSMPGADGSEPLMSLPMDFARFPWLAGMPLADPDGDGLRNDQEMIQVNTADPQPSNTDPTPLWMTDPTFSYSFTAQYYRQGSMIPVMWPLSSNSGSGAADIEGNGYMFSFEMNEGYDTDNDGIPDGQEITKTVRSASDPQLFTDPMTRQALYFPGRVGDVSSLAISFEPEHPANSTTRRVTSAADIFRQFTVECWIRPESASLAVGSKCTVLERVCAYPQSNYQTSPDSVSADELHYLRATFRIGIEDGHLYGLIDNSDAQESEAYLGVSSAKVVSDVALAADTWYHVAITYDGAEFAIIVKARDEADRKGRRKSLETSIIPANGVTEVLQQPNKAFPYYSYEAYDTAFLLGASADEVGINLHSTDPRTTADNYSRHYVGYIGEVRVWDGVRTVEQIAEAHDRKLSYDEIVQIRNDVYDSWSSKGGTRSANDGTEVLPAELVQQYTFDGLHGATEPDYVATAPSAFDYNVKAPASEALSALNGEDVEIWVGWLASLDESLRPSVYTDYAYVPWIKNMAAHLPMMDGSVADSVYWGENLAGDHPPTEARVSKYVFPNTANPYAFAVNNRDLTIRHMRYTVLNGGTQDEDSASTNTTTSTSLYTSLLDLYRFDLRCRMSSTSDLVPVGGVYAKRCVDYWDGQGAMDADLVTSDGMGSADAKGNGLPDWWEEYCRDNYFSGMGYDPGMAMTLDTLVNYGGITIKASEAYLRDLAKGMLPTASTDDDFKDVADFDYDGMPDWWEKIYGIDTGSVADAKADSDNDGLNNLTEYILSERFELKDTAGDRKKFSPIDVRSGGTVDTDYFFRIGDLYVGEIFADHDWIEDWWEEGYRADYVSMLEYDAAGDRDGDGWSAWAEARYSQQVSPIVANNLFHYNVTDGFVPDYPIPTLQLKVRYNGTRKSVVRNSSIGIKVGRTLDPAKSFDAEFYVRGSLQNSASAAGSTAGSNASSNLYTHVIGKWSDRHVYGTLTPGFINSTSIELQTAYDPSAVVYSWLVTVGGAQGVSSTTLYQRGTKAEYNQAMRTYGSDNVTMLSMSDGYGKLEGLEIRTDLTSEMATLRFKNGVEAGTINLKTGEYDLDLGVFKNGIVQSATNENHLAALEDQTYRFVYSANESTGLPRDLYLGEADNGYVYEGKNSMIVWADLDGNGEFDVGEPFGFARDVDIGWRRRAIEVELFDRSPVTPRINLLASTMNGAGSYLDHPSDRGETLDEFYVTISNKYIAVLDSAQARRMAIEQMEWVNVNGYAPATVSAENGELTRVRVVRWLVDGTPVYSIGAPAEVVFDKMINLAEHPTLTEADLLVDGSFDIDWNWLATTLQSDWVGLYGLDAASVAYLVVVGDGPIMWDGATDSETILKIANQVIERRYDVEHAKAAVYSPGAAQSVVYDGRPTFSWTIPGSSEELSYTAFQIQILPESGSGVVWDSGVQLMPPRDENGRYVWTAPAYVGNELEASVNYRWRVTGLNAKFRTPNWSETSVFRMEPNTVGADCGRIDVCVKYFGPKAEVLNKGRVVVEAFESPDFTGNPAARAVVTDQADVAAVEAEHSKQVSLIGLRKGVYYVRAYIDSNAYGVRNVRDSWESWGYLTDRSGSKNDIFAPLALEIDDSVARGDLAVVYIEDADTNGNRLPDAWEMAVNGGHLSNGTSDIDKTLDCGLAVKDSLADTISAKQDADTNYVGMVAHFLGTLRSRGMAALALGVAPSSIDVNSSGQIVVENKVKSLEIESISFSGGTLSIAVAGDVCAAVDGVASDLYDVTTEPTKTVVCEVYRRNSLAAEDDWSLVASAEVSVGVGATEINVPEAAGESGFFKVVIRQ